MIKQEDIVELSFENGMHYKMYLPFKESDYIQKIVFNTKKPYEYEMLSYILTQIPKNSTLLDIGMNIANHSLFLAANGFKIYAFEANSKMSAIAKESIRLNGFEDRIKIYEFGVSDRDEKAYFEKEKPWNFGSMSLSTIDENHQENLDFIECKSIDSLDIQDEIALVKIDIEGMESKALKGMKELIKKNRPIIYAEANFVEDFLKIDRILNEFNYVHWDIFGNSPTHLYYPIEKLNLNQMLQKNLSNIAGLKLYWTEYMQKDCFLHRIVNSNLNETKQMKRDLTLNLNEMKQMKKDLALNLNEVKQIKEFIKELTKNTENVNYLKKTLTYRWGKSLVESSKSVCKFFILPLTLCKDYRAFRQYLKKRNKK